MINVKLEKFAGPLSLLLNLIEKQKLDITEISLAKVADQYIQHIKKIEKINPEETADFLLIASRLLLIKSKALLPYLSLNEEEEEDLEELEKQLKMYQEFVQASQKIEEILKNKRFTYPRQVKNKIIIENNFSPPKKLTIQDLKNTWLIILSRIKPKPELEQEKMEISLSLEEQIFNIKKIITEKIKLSFNKILASSRSKTEKIVSFLAILELIKQKHINVKQDNLFSEIFISKI